MNFKTKITKITVTPKIISKLSNVLKSTNLELSKYRLISEKNTVSGFQFFEDDYSLHKVLELLEKHPVLSSVKTPTFETHVYQIADMQVTANYFFSKEDRGTFLVLSPYERI